MDEKETGRTKKQIARDVNSQVRRAEEALAALFKDTDQDKKHDLLCALLGLISEIAINNLGGEDPLKALGHLENLLHTHFHAAALHGMDREERREYCSGCDAHGDCMAQSLIEDWEEHEGVPKHIQS